MQRQNSYVFSQRGFIILHGEAPCKSLELLCLLPFTLEANRKVELKPIARLNYNNIIIPGVVSR